MSNEKSSPCAEESDTLLSIFAAFGGLQGWLELSSSFSWEARA